MAIFYSNGGSLVELATNKISSLGHVIQTVEVTQAGNQTFGSGGGGDLFSASITTHAAANRVLVYMFVYERIDPGNGPWAITFNNLRYSGPGSGNGSNIIASGWNGTTRYYLGHYEKYFLHNPAAAGTHTYTANVNNYPNGATAYYNHAGNQNSDGNGIIRLMEIGG